MRFTVATVLCVATLVVSVDAASADKKAVKTKEVNGNAKANQALRKKLPTKARNNKAAASVEDKVMAEDEGYWERFLQNEVPSITNPPTPSPTNPPGTCDTTVDIECKITMPDGSTVDCMDVPTEGPEDCGPKPVEYCYTIENIGDECGDINAILRTRTPPGTTEDLIGLVSEEDKNLCPGDIVVVCEDDTVDTCDKECYETMIEVNADMPNGFVCNSMDEYTFCIEPGCNVDVKTECEVELPDGTTVPCTEIPVYPPDECPMLETKNCYTISNIGQTCGDITKFERTRTPPGAPEGTDDLLPALIESLEGTDEDTNLCPGESLEFCETEMVDTCVDQCYETSVVVEATMPDSFVCEGDDLYIFCVGVGTRPPTPSPTPPPTPGPTPPPTGTCDTTVTIECKITMPDGSTVDCMDVPTEGPEDCGPKPVEYCYTIENIGDECGDINAILRTRTPPGTTEDLIGLVSEEDKNLCPGDIVVVCEDDTVDTCDKECYETMIEVNADMPNGFVCNSMDEYTFCIEPGCNVDVKTECEVELPDGTTVPCTEIPVYPPDECPMLETKNCYTISNIGQTCGDITKFERTRTPPGAPEGTDDLLPALIESLEGTDEDTNLCPGESLEFCETEMVDTCVDQCYETSVVVEATMPDSFVCEGDDLYIFCVGVGTRPPTPSPTPPPTPGPTPPPTPGPTPPPTPGPTSPPTEPPTNPPGTCDLTITTVCKLDGTETDCTDIPTEGPDDCGPKNIEYCYTMENIGDECGIIDKFESTKTPPGTTTDLLGLLSDDDKNFCPGETITVCEVASVDTCVKECYKNEVVVSATMEVNGFVCEADDEYEFCIDPGCAVDVETECEATLPDGSKVPCEEIPTGPPGDGPGDCGAVMLEYCYTVDNIGNSCGVLTTFERTWTATPPGTPNTKDLIDAFYQEWGQPVGTEYCPDDPAITVCEEVEIDSCERVCYETTVVVDATMPDGFVCEAEGEYEFCVEPGCKVEVETECEATLPDGSTLPCDQVSPTIDDCGPITKEYCYTISNVGNSCGDITKLERIRTPPGGAGGTVDLLPGLIESLEGTDEDINLCPEETLRYCEPTETVDTCDDQCYLTEVVVEATMPDGFICEAEDLYELCINPGCRIETDITCTLNDGSGTLCEEIPPASANDCGLVPVEYCYKIDNVGPTGNTCGTINKIDRTRTPPGTTESILEVLIPNPDDRLLCGGDSITVCEVALVDSCVEQCYETTVVVDATMTDGFVCEALDEYEFCVPPPSSEVCNVEVDLECVMDPERTIDGSTSCDAIIPIATRCDKRASVMTWRYNGGDCEQSFNIQEADKFTCTDFAGGAPLEGSSWLTVTSAKDESEVYFDGEVEVGQLFSMFAANTGKGKFDADSFFYVYRDSSKAELLQLSSVHTSCSQNLFLKDKFGSVQLLIFENEFGLFTCFVQATYGFTITNQGAADSGTIVEFTSTTNGVSDDCLDNIPPADSTVQPGDTVIVDKQVLIDMTVRQEYNTVAYIRAETPGGFSCDDTATLQFTAGNPNLPSFAP